MNDLNPSNNAPIGGLAATPDRVVTHYQTSLKVILNEYDEDDDTYHVILADEEDGCGSCIEMISCPPSTAAQFVVGSEWPLDAALG